jgi:hypothetical protein
MQVAGDGLDRVECLSIKAFDLRAVPHGIGVR